MIEQIDAGRSRRRRGRQNSARIAMLGSTEPPAVIDVFSFVSYDDRHTMYHVQLDLRKYIPLVALLLGLIPYGASADSFDSVGIEYVSREISPATMQAELEFVADALSRIHPATIDGFSPQQHALIRELRTQFGQPLSFARYWYSLNRVFLSFDDAHTSLYIPDSDDSDGTPYVELPIRWVEHSVVAVEDFSGVDRGDLIRSIGGRSVRELLRRVDESYASTETDEWLRHRFPQYVASTYFLTLEGLLTAENTLELEIEKPNGSKHNVIVQLQPGHRETTPQSTTGTWHFYENDDIAVYEIRYMSGSLLFRNDVLRFFREVERRNITRVAIDVRRSPGGNSQAIQALLHALPRRSGRPTAGFVRLSTEAAEQRPYSRTSGTDTYDSESPDPVEDDRLESLQLGYQGDVYLLTSWATFSAAGDLAATLQDYQLATVVGEPPGNSPPSYGNVIFLETPLTGLKFGVSHAYYSRPWDQSARRVVPNVHVPMTVEAFRQGRDPVLEYLFEGE